MKTYIIERCSDPVLNKLWVRTTFPPIRAEDGNEVLRAFRNSDHPMRDWIEVRAVELTLVQQVHDYVARAEQLVPVALTPGKRAALWDMFQELVLKAENAELRAEAAAALVPLVEDVSTAWENAGQGAVEFADIMGGSFGATLDAVGAALRKVPAAMKRAL